VGPETQDETRSAQFPLLFCLLRLSELHLTTRMAPGPPPARERGPVSQRAPQGGMLGTSRRRPGPPPRGVRVLHVTPGPPKCTRQHSVQGVRDRHAPHRHWCTQDPDLQGPRNITTPRLEDCTPHSDDHAASWGWQGAGAISARSRTIPGTTAMPDAMPHSVLSTVFDHCTPAIWGKTTTSHSPAHVHRPSL